MRIGTLVAGYAFIAWIALGPWLDIYRRRDELRKGDQLDEEKAKAFKWTVGVVVFVGVVGWLMTVAASGPNPCPEGSYWDRQGGGMGQSGPIGACV